MSAMRDYITPQERTDIFPPFDLRKKFVVEELNNIFYRRMLDNERQANLEAALDIIKIKGNK